MTWTKLTKLTEKRLIDSCRWEAGKSLQAQTSSYCLRVMVSQARTRLISTILLPKAMSTVLKTRTVNSPNLKVCSQCRNRSWSSHSLALIKCLPVKETLLTSRLQVTNLLAKLSQYWNLLVRYLLIKISKNRWLTGWLSQMLYDRAGQERSTSASCRATKTLIDQTRIMTEWDIEIAIQGQSRMGHGILISFYKHIPLIKVPLSLNLIK